MTIPTSGFADDRGNGLLAAIDGDLVVLWDLDTEYERVTEAVAEAETDGDSEVVGDTVCDVTPMKPNNTKNATRSTRCIAPITCKGK